MHEATLLTAAPRRIRAAVLAALAGALVFAHQAGTVAAAEPCEELKKLKDAASDAATQVAKDAQAINDAVAAQQKDNPAGNPDELAKHIKDFQDSIDEVTTARTAQKAADKLREFDQTEDGKKLISLNMRIEELKESLAKAEQVKAKAKIDHSKQVQELDELRYFLAEKAQKLAALDVTGLAQQEALKAEIVALRLQVTAKSTELYSPDEMKLIFGASKAKTDLDALGAEAEPLTKKRLPLEQNRKDEATNAYDAKRTNLKVLQIMVAKWNKSLQLGVDVRTKEQAFIKSVAAADQADKDYEAKKAEIETAAAHAVQAAKDEAGDLDKIALEIQKNKDLFKAKLTKQEKDSLRAQAKRIRNPWRIPRAREC